MDSQDSGWMEPHRTKLPSLRFIHAAACVVCFYIALSFDPRLLSFDIANVKLGVLIFRTGLRGFDCVAFFCLER